VDTSHNVRQTVSDGVGIDGVGRAGEPDRALAEVVDGGSLSK
jgi:hypothetical protein